MIVILIVMIVMIVMKVMKVMIVMIVMFKNSKTGRFATNLAQRRRNTEDFTHNLGRHNLKLMRITSILSMKMGTQEPVQYS